MDPLDFLKVADNLKDSSDEAERRTAVSRAYYQSSGRKQESFFR